MCWQESPIGPGHSRWKCVASTDLLLMDQKTWRFMKVKCSSHPSTPQPPKKQQHPTSNTKTFSTGYKTKNIRWNVPKKRTNIQKSLVKSDPCFFSCSFFGCDFNSPVFSTSENKNTQKRHVWRWVWGPSSRGFVRIPSGFSKVDEKVLGVSLSLKGGGSVSLKMGDVLLK